MALRLARTPEQKQFKITQLGTLLDEQYLKQQKEPGWVQKKSFAPSNVGYGKGTCPRFWYYQFTGYDAIPDATAKDIASMSYGSEAGKRIADLFREADILVDDEVKAELKDPPVFGYIDVIVDWNGEEVIGEIKTTRQESFAMRETTMTPPVYNLIQLLLYMHIKQKKRGFLLYENKNTQEFLTIPIVMDDVNQAIVDKTIEWMKTVHQSWQDEVLPTRPFPSIKNKVCKDCPVKEMCWEDRDGDKDLPILEIGG